MGTTPARRGVALPTAATLGHAPASTLGPTDGDGFLTRWRDDLAVLADAGVADVRITFDWPRLQPRPGRLDGDWAEWFGAVVAGCAELGMSPWACLHDGGTPRWFDDEGGFADVDAVSRWWPRWAEAAADRFGGSVAGWLPMLSAPEHHRTVWHDTWSALRGGPPVALVVALPADRRLLEPALALECDLLGVSLTADTSSERLGVALRMAAEDGPERPLVVADTDVSGLEAAAHADALGATRAAIDEAVHDGIEVGVAFATCPLDDTHGLGPEARAWLS